MTLTAVKCPVCNWYGTFHGYRKGTALRDHIRGDHPDVEAEIRTFEQETREKRTALRAKYGRDFFMAL